MKNVLVLGGPGVGKTHYGVVQLEHWFSGQGAFVVFHSFGAASNSIFAPRPTTKRAIASSLASLVLLHILTHAFSLSWGLPNRDAFVPDCVLPAPTARQMMANSTYTYGPLQYILWDAVAPRLDSPPSRRRIGPGQPGRYTESLVCRTSTKPTTKAASR